MRDIEAAENAPVLNRESLLRRVGGDAEVVAQILQDIGASLPVRLEECRRAFQSGDFHTLQVAAHTIKGSAATAGAERVALLAAALHRAAGEGARDPVSIAQLIGELAERVDELIDRIGGAR